MASEDTGFVSSAELETPRFVSLRETFKCSYCKGVLRDPIQTVCGHRLCRCCASSLLSDKKDSIQCPANSDDCVEITQDKLFPDNFTKREIANEKVYCCNYQQGCCSIMKWKNLSGHLRTCTYTSALCPNREMGRGTTGPKYSWESHRDTCDVRHVACDSFEENVQHLEMKQESDISNDVLPSLAVQRSQGTSNSHIVQPSDEMPTSSQGEILQYSGAEDANIQEDFGTLLASIDTRLTRHGKCIAENDVRLHCLETSSYEGLLVWKITEYAHRKRDAELGKTLSLNSIPFYAGRYGYKMCLRVYLNGDGRYQGTHLSLYLVLMKGPFDNILPWPFAQKVKLSLLAQSGVNGDQYGKVSHINQHLKPPTHSTNWGFLQPVGEMNVGTGCADFCKISKLERYPYLMEDTIFIKAKVDIKKLDP